MVGFASHRAHIDTIGIDAAAPRENDDDDDFGPHA